MIGWQLVRLTNEAATHLRGGIVESLRFDQSSGRLLLQLGSRHGKRFVVVGVRPPKPTLYWVTRRTDLPSASAYDPTERFNRLRDSRLTDIALPRADRLLRLDFDKQKDDTTQAFSLWLGWMGGSGNIWLTDRRENTVLEMLWKTSAQSIGQPFELPKPPPLVNWQKMTFPDYSKEREENSDLPLGRFLRKRLWGIDDELSEYIESESVSDDLWEEFSGVISRLREIVDPQTPLRIKRDERKAPKIVPNPDAASSTDSTTSLAHILSKLDREEVQVARHEERIHKARSQVQSRVKQLRRRLRSLDQAISEGERAEPTKRLGDLLNANRHLIKRGQASVEVTDWEQGGTQVVSLDPKLSPQENIESYYKRARKLARGAEQATNAKPQIEHDLYEAEEQLDRLDDEDLGPDELESLTAASNQRSERTGRSSQAQAPRVPYREFAVGKFTILVGKSRRDNDELTLHVARPHDLFLHADKVGGSHVIIRVPEKGRGVPRDVLTVAAQAAAYFSKAKHSSVVPVIYTEVRHVSKSRKAPPGLVRVSREQSVMVEPAPPPGYHDDDRDS